MLFLIDGYNVTMSDPATSGLDKESQREALIGRMNARSGQILGAGTVVIVFDARSELAAHSNSQGVARVVYAPDADAEIVRRCQNAKGQIGVVTSDMRLRARLSQDVARRVEYHDASACFEASGKGERRRGGARQSTEEPPPATAKRITEELEGIWVRGEESDGSEQ